MVAQTIPLAPFLEGRGEEIKALWGTPPDPCQRGGAPLDSPARNAHCGCLPPHVLVPLPPPSRAGLPRRPAAAPDCFAAEEIKALWGTPPDPCQRGGAPLDSPARNAHCGCLPPHVLVPLPPPSRAGLPRRPAAAPDCCAGEEIKALWGTPQTPAKEAVPLWTPPHVMPIVDVPPHVLVPLPPPSRAGLPRRPTAAPDCFAGARNDGKQVAEYLEQCHPSVVSSPLFHMY